MHIYDGEAVVEIANYLIFIGVCMVLSEFGLQKGKHPFEESSRGFIDLNWASPGWVVPKQKADT